MSVILDRIIIYPIKSLDGLSVQSAKIMPGGSLEHDREFAIFDHDNKVVNGKRTAKIQLLRSQFDLAQRTVTISVQQENPQTFHLDNDRVGLAQWLSDYFGFDVQIQQNLQTGFPDDRNSPGPTIISTQTLSNVSQWFGNITVGEMRDRFRTNLEITVPEAFWEDRLFGDLGEMVNFQVGKVQFQGINPCLRCIVPTRHPVTTEATPDFQKLFSRQREANLSSWTKTGRFKSFYRLAVNTIVPAAEEGKVLRVGDVLSQIQI
jgi:uncharacterized protein